MALDVPTLAVRDVGDLREAHLSAMAQRPAKRFIYRGQRADHPLTTSLERACIDTDGDLKRARRREVALIREFMRRFHHYSPQVPSEDHLLEWLSLMQHHGAPTRLLDWTYSIYVAAYFAIEYARERRRRLEDKPSDGQVEPASDAAVWMLDMAWAAEAAAAEFSRNNRRDAMEYVALRPKILDDEPRFGDVIKADRSVACVWPENPFRLNERLTIQKGVFVCVGDVVRTFEENLKALEGHRENMTRLIIPADRLDTMLGELFYMNITRATLFPGLDGFAHSLRINLASLPTSWKSEAERDV